MTKKDYELIADILDNYSSYDKFRRCSVSTAVVASMIVCEVALDLAKAFAKDNPRFNEDKFLRACGVKVRNE